MKHILLLLFILSTLALHAQSAHKPLPIAISYYGPFAIQPGLKLSAFFDAKNWQQEGKTKQIDQSIYWSPQLAAFTQNNSQTAIVANLEAGIRRQVAGKKAYTMLSLGLGYLANWEVEEIAVHLGSGELNKSRVYNGFLLPSVNASWGKQVNPNWAYFFKGSFARKISTELEDEAFMALELGLCFKLFK